MKPRDVWPLVKEAVKATAGRVARQLGIGAAVGRQQRRLAEAGAGQP